MLGCSVSHRFPDCSSGGNLNRRGCCLRSAGICASRCPTVTWRNSLPSGACTPITSPSGGGSNVTPQKFSDDCDRGSDRPTTAGGWMRPTSGLRAKTYLLVYIRLVPSLLALYVPL